LLNNSPAGRREVKGIDDDRRDNCISELNQSAIDLIVSVGILASVMGRFPPEVEENFVEKIENLSILIREETAEFHLFGEALDEGVDDQ
jgi:hypothetical protein